MTLQLPTTRYDPQLEAQTHLKSSRTRFNLLRSRKRNPPPVTQPLDVSVAALPTVDSDPLIDVDFTPYESEEEEYRWVILYENQRGLKFFSTAYFSDFSLLPIDPSPFTIPGASGSRSKQPDVSFANYPLPDGSWQWQSPWMVDMRDGDMQPDGFQYNWYFRKHHWHPEAGPFSWVRRRKWLRLMVRPAKGRDQDLVKSPENSSPNTPQTSIDPRSRISVASSLHTSVLGSLSEEEMNLEDSLIQIWLDMDAEQNYEKYRRISKSARTDGRLLELWQQWLGLPEPQPPKDKKRQWTEDEDAAFLEIPPTEPRSSTLPAPPIDNILPTLQSHGEKILQSFVYPESRTRFRQMLETVGVDGLSLGTQIEFWSYT